MSTQLKHNEDFKQIRYEIIHYTGDSESATRLNRRVGQRYFETQRPLSHLALNKKYKFPNRRETQRVTHNTI